MKQSKWQYIMTFCTVITIMTLGTAMANDSATRLPPLQTSELGTRSSSRSHSTDVIKAKVQGILANYNADNLTKEDATAINNAFREAGIRKGPAQRQAIIAAGFSPQSISSLDPPPERKSAHPAHQQRNPNTVGPTNPAEQGMSLDQTLSDQAQTTTIAFDSLAFLTGDLCADSFLPPGKVADFSGFQYLRDNDPTGLGHNTDFVTIIAFNILDILSESQIEQLVTLAQNQVTMINDHGFKRFPLMKAFRRLLEGEIPDTSTGLSRKSVMEYSAELYRLDGQISYDRAETLGDILRNLTAPQKTSLNSLITLKGVGNWDKNKEDLIRIFHPGLSHDEHVAVMTYASEMYSWYAGSVAADTYFCPERQGTYFGSFYMKDMPAMGNPDFTIPDNLTAGMGNRFLAALTDSQVEMVTDLVDTQRGSLYEIVSTRRAISTQLRLFMKQETVNEAELLALAERYGELDGEIVYNYATTFSAMANTLSNTQAVELMKMREEWNEITCSGAYLYSAPIDRPEISGTDFFFQY